MLTPAIKHCPQCGGALNVEHTAEEDLVDHAITYLYCDFCQLGLETLWEKQGDKCRERFSLTFEASRDPIKLGKFLQRLENVRAA